MSRQLYLTDFLGIGVMVGMKQRKKGGSHGG